MKKVFLCLCLLFSWMLNAQTLKNYICTIKPKDSVSKEMIEQTSKNLESTGFYTSSKLIKEREKNSGTGFVVTDKTGNRYVMTSSAVVSNADMVSMAFDFESGKVIFDNCKVVRKNDSLKVALIELPNHFPIKGSLSFSSKEIEDADEVFTAGYPFLGDSVVWQIGQGNVTNAKTISRLFDNDKLYVIQHSSQVNRGGQGGPLLSKVEDSKKKTSYQVLGMNVWKAIYRENTNYSVPKEYLLDYLNNYKPIEEDEVQVVERVARAFADSISSNFVSASEFVSDKLIYSYNEEDFRSLIQNAGRITSMPAKYIRSQNPEMGLRLLPLVYILAYSDFDSIAYKQMVVEDGQYKVEYEVAKGSCFATFEKEFGRFQITAVAVQEGKKKQTKSVSKKAFEYHNEGFNFRPETMGFVDFGVGIPLNQWYLVDYNLTAGLEFSYLFADLHTSIGRSYADEDENYIYYGKCTEIIMSLGVRVPMGVNRVFIEPYLGGGLGAELIYGTSKGLDWGILFNGKGGIVVGYDVKPFLNVYGAVEFNAKLVDATFGPFIEIKTGLKFRKRK
ncbi:MAG: trypsin-like peptidase domain-containing protein [Paludibacteraceae bacterium]|nr:trypsin-like peptidase domain-containing protein [Paludibacteraceae bacterium]